MTEQPRQPKNPTLTGAVLTRLAIKRLGAPQIAKLSGLSEVSVYQYAKGLRVPRADYAAMLAKGTHGLVPVAAWDERLLSEAAIRAKEQAELAKRYGDV